MSRVPAQLPTLNTSALPLPCCPQGLRHIGLAASLEAVQAAFEAGGLFAVLRGWLLAHMPVLQALGILKLIAALVYTAAGLLAVASMAPGGLQSGSAGTESGSSGSEAGDEAGGRAGALPAQQRDVEDAEAPVEPLLAEWRQEESAAGRIDCPATKGLAPWLWQELRAALGWRHLGSMLRDGGNVAVRAVVVQGSTFLVALAAARLGQSALAAHHIAQQLWVLPSHLIAGLQTAAIVLGGRLAAEAGGRGCEAHRCGGRGRDLLPCACADGPDSDASADHPKPPIMLQALAPSGRPPAGLGHLGRPGGSASLSRPAPPPDRSLHPRCCGGCSACKPDRGGGDGVARAVPAVPAVCAHPRPHRAALRTRHVCIHALPAARWLCACALPRSLGCQPHRQPACSVAC